MLGIRQKVIAAATPWSKLRVDNEAIVVIWLGLSFFKRYLQSLDGKLIRTEFSGMHQEKICILSRRSQAKFSPYSGVECHMHLVISMVLYRLICIGRLNNDDGGTGYLPRVVNNQMNSVMINPQLVRLEWSLT